MMFFGGGGCSTLRWRMLCKGGGGTVCGCVCWRKGCVPAAGCVAERGGERSFHSLENAALRLLQVRDERLKVKERNRNRPPPFTSFRSELRRETTLKPSLTYPLRWQATFALRRNEDVVCRKTPSVSLRKLRYTRPP